MAIGDWRINRRLVIGEWIGDWRLANRLAIGESPLLNHQ
jgi:hypothetical protein